MKRTNRPWRLRFRPPVTVTVLFFASLATLLILPSASAQEGKYDAVYDSLHENPAPSHDALKTGAATPVTDEALSLHPDVDTRNADDITTAISNRDEMPPLVSLPAGAHTSVDAGINRQGPAYDSPTEFHRVTDSNHNDAEVYYLNLNIRF